MRMPYFAPFTMARGDITMKRAGLQLGWVWLFLFASNFVIAQTPGTGAISGIVKDPQGLAIVDATVTVTNHDNGSTRTVQTTAAGNYAVLLLQPGTYDVEASKAGFKNLKSEGIAVNVTETVGLNVTLPVGSIGETVEVRSSATDLQTETASLGIVTTAEQVVDLPLVNRNFTQIVGLAPGVSTEVTNAADIGRGNGGLTASSGRISVSGASVADNSYQMNGANVNDLQESGGDSGGYPIPNPDTIQEFKVQTVAYDASYGRAGGGNVNVITKGGTNSYHGSAFEFFRDTGLNANDWFLNEAGQPRGVLHQNQFGMTFGGPIKVDKLTFFTSYQGTRQENGLTGDCLTSFVGPALTDANRTAAALGAMFAGQPTLYQQQNGVGPGTPGYGIGVAPDGSNISPQALALLNFKLPNGQFLIPNGQTPNVGSMDPASASQTVISQACPFTEDQFMGNVNWSQSHKSQWQERFFFANSDETLSFSGTGTPGFPATLPNHFRNFSLSNEYAFSPNLLNQAVIGYNRLWAQRHQDTFFSWPNVGVGVPAMDSAMIPVFTIDGYASVGGNGQDTTSSQDQYSLQDNLSWVKGRHVIRFGGGVERDTIIGDLLSNVGLTFGTWPDFLLGLAGGPLASRGNDTGTAPGTVPTSNVENSGDRIGNLSRDIVSWDRNLYVQDDIKVTKTFTLNAGLRYEYLGGLAEKNGFNTNFDIAEAAATPPITGGLQGYVVAGNYPAGTPPTGVRVNHGSDLAISGQGRNVINPRIGFAWQLPHTSRLVLRGGYGLYHEKPYGQVLGQSVSNPPWSLARGFSTFDISFANPIPGGDIPFPTFMGAELTPTSHQTPTGFANDFRPPSIQHFGLNVQALLPGNMVWEVGYVGSRGTHLISNVTPDQAALASPSHPIRGVTTNTVDLDNIIARLPVQGLDENGFIEFTNGDVSWYNSLEARLSKRFSHGLQFLASYTWARSFTSDADTIRSNVGGARFGNQLTGADPQHWGPDEFVRPHRFVFSGIYELPTPGGWSGLLKSALGGWRVSGVLTLQSGQRLSLLDFNFNNVYGQFLDNTHLSGACSPSQYVRRGSVQSKIQNYINASCFDENYPIIGDDGVATDFGNARPGIIVGPDQNNVDMALSKIVTLVRPRETKLEFRAEAFNLFNHPEFGNPDTFVPDGPGSFGRIGNMSTSPRVLQLALKINF